MRIVPTPKNHFSKLKEIKVKVENNSTPIEEKQRLSIEAAKLVLPIWEVYHKDNHPHLAIQAAEEYLNNPTEENKERTRKIAFAAYDIATDAVVDAAAYAAYSAAYVAYAAYAVDAVYYASTVYAAYAVTNAIGATKEFFKIK